MYYQPSTNTKLSTHSDIRAKLTNVMFGDVITDNDLVQRGVYELKYVKPDVPEGQIAVEGDVLEADGIWTQQWTIRDATAEEVEAMKPPVPFSVTRRQARQALAIKGVLDKVEAAIAALDNGTPAGAQKALLVKIEWQDSLNFERHRPMVIAIGAAVGFDSDELDDLFRFAATL